MVVLQVWSDKGIPLVIKSLMRWVSIGPCAELERVIDRGVDIPGI